LSPITGVFNCKNEILDGMGIILETNEPEKAWNWIRFANTALNQAHDVKLFLISAGVNSRHLGVFYLHLPRLGEGCVGSSALAQETLCVPRGCGSSRPFHRPPNLQMDVDSLGLPDLSVGARRNHHLAYPVEVRTVERRRSGRKSGLSSFLHKSGCQDDDGDCLTLLPMSILLGLNGLGDSRDESCKRNF
jgi:hypothetical protein